MWRKRGQSLDKILDKVCLYVIYQLHSEIQIDFYLFTAL